LSQAVSCDGAPGSVTCTLVMVEAEQAPSAWQAQVAATAAWPRAPVVASLVVPGVVVEVPAE